MKLCVVGQGYVGLPLTVLFGKQGLDVIGFDIDAVKIEELQQHEDKMQEVDKADLQACHVAFTADPSEISQGDVVIVAVPTPIDENNTPDLGMVKSASALVGKHLKKNAIVVYESTVYPGVTEEICRPILEKESEMTCGVDFKVGYSPERVNPGDKEHTIDKITKIVAGMDAESTEQLAELYGTLTKIHKAPSIKVAEAAKVIENIQRDLNIALMNELSIIFNKMDINTRDVIEAAGTKWNFHKYYPGLVGGHCIGVDPYYLTYKAQQLGYHPQVILAGRRINDNMHKDVLNRVISGLNEQGKALKNAKVLILGLTFKENVSDYRNSRVKQFIDALSGFGCSIIAMDPYLSVEDIRSLFGVRAVQLGDALEENIDCVILATKHDAFKELSLEHLHEKMARDPVLIDIHSFYDGGAAKNMGFAYNCL